MLDNSFLRCYDYAIPNKPMKKTSICGFNAQRELPRVRWQRRGGREWTFEGKPNARVIRGDGATVILQVYVST